MKHLKIIALTLSVGLLFGLTACGNKDTDGNAGTTNSETKSETKKDDESATALAAFNQYAADLMKNADGELVVSAEKWTDSPLFDDIVAVSAMGGLTPYQGTAKDPLTVVSQPIKTDYDPSWNIQSTLKAALNDKGEVVLLWNEWIETFPTLEAQEPIVANMAVNWTAENMLMRLNDLRGEQGKAPLTVADDNIASPDAASVPSQNSNVGDPDNMTEEEQQAYNETQENVEIAEEQADSQE